mgnify:CR=1 FL=1
MVFWAGGAYSSKDLEQSGCDVQIPHTLFVATVAPKGFGKIGEVSPEESWLVVYIIDTVTGHILYRLKHPNMHGPVHAVIL